MNSDTAYDYDIIIAGGGAVGAALACALDHKQNHELRIAIVESKPPTTEHDDNGKGLALSLTTKHILENIGIWCDLQQHANPIKSIHVSDQYHFGRVLITANTMGIPALGYVVRANELSKAFMQYFTDCQNITLISPATLFEIDRSEYATKVTIDINGSHQQLTSKVLIGADGINSKTRKILNIATKVKDYQQTAIVSQLSAEYPHHDTAYERFTNTGPLALLPQPQQRFVLVLTVPTEQANSYLQMDENNFLSTVAQRFGKRLGKFSALSQRHSHPLKMSIATQQIRHRAVIIGNAAHSLHPNASQGFNLGLRDAVTLAEILLIAHRNKQDIGALATLNHYLDARINDQQRVINFTDKLTRYFYNDHPGRIITRNIAMLAIDLIPAIKRHFTRRAMGYVPKPALYQPLATLK